MYDNSMDNCLDGVYTAVLTSCDGVTTYGGLNNSTSTEFASLESKLPACVDKAISHQCKFISAEDLG